MFRKTEKSLSWIDKRLITLSSLHLVFKVQAAFGFQVAFWLCRNFVLASQKLGFLWKLRFNFVEAALSDDPKSGYPFHRP